MLRAIDCAAPRRRRHLHESRPRLHRLGKTQPALDAFQRPPASVPRIPGPTCRSASHSNGSAATTTRSARAAVRCRSNPPMPMRTIVSGGHPADLQRWADAIDAFERVVAARRGDVAARSGSASPAATSDGTPPRLRRSPRRWRSTRISSRPTWGFGSIYSNLDRWNEALDEPAACGRARAGESGGAVQPREGAGQAGDYEEALERSRQTVLSRPDRIRRRSSGWV